MSVRSPSWERASERARDTERERANGFQKKKKNQTVIKILFFGREIFKFSLIDLWKDVFASLARRVTVWPKSRERERIK